MQDYYASLNKSTEIETNSKIVNTKTTKTSKNTGMVYHKIRRGENLGLIASKYGVSVNQLRDWNNISGNKIVSGRSLRIYPDGTSNYVAVTETKNTVSKIIFTSTKLKR